MPRSLIGFFAAAALHAAPPVPTTPAEIPAEYFFRSPAVAGAQLNPAGTHVGMRIYDASKDSYGLVFLDVATHAITGTRGDSAYNVYTFIWVGDECVVFNVSRDKHYEWGLFSMSRLDVKSVVPLFPHGICVPIGSPHARPNSLFVLAAGSKLRLLEVDVRTSGRSNIGRPDRNVIAAIDFPPDFDSVRRWLRDREGEIRYAIAFKGANGFLFRLERDGNWTPVKLNLDQDVPLAVDTNAAVLLLAHLNAEGRRELRRFDTRDHSLGPVLYTDEKYDFASGTLRFTPDGREPAALTYAQQAPARYWFRPEDSALQASIDAALPPERLNHITSRSVDGQRVLVTSGSDRHPGTLYFIDLAAHKVRKIADLAPWLPEKLLAPVRLMSFRTRDGLTLDGYVTLPQNYVEGTPAPTVVLPHGGPWARDVWGYEPWSQFLASRGYVVFRPNYRGSSGYNAALSLAPAMEFRKMHDDVTDGVRALVAAKISDPAHLAIFGASFGGYLAMSGAAFEPDLYKCAITFAGVFDWAELMQQDKDNGNEYRYAWLRRDFGDPEKDRAKFDAMSPLQAVTNVRIPIFVAHGKEDRNADTDQSRSLVRTLKKAGVPHEAWFIPDEAHGLSELAHRTELFTRVEAFLKKHL